MTSVIAQHGLPIPAESFPFAIILISYLLGSIPFGYLIVKFGQGRDIRASGSGNIGAANVTRTVGKGAGVLTLLLDAAKGFVAVWLAMWFGASATWVVVAALVAILGHMFPVWLKFKGGKGVATGVGAFIPICWQAVAGALAVWIVTVAIFRYVSLGSMLAAASLPVLTYYLYAPEMGPPVAITAGATLAAIIIIAAHRANIARLAAGTEPKLGQKAK